MQPKHIRITAIIAALIIMAAFVAINPLPVRAADTGTIEIVKDSRSESGTFFAFQSDIPGHNFPFLVKNGETKTMFSIPPGQYTVFEENSNPDWELTDISCTDPSGNSTGDLANREANIDLSADETVRCTFTNEVIEPGRIIIRDFSSGVDGPIGFTSSLPGNATFSLDANGSLTVSELPAGTYTVTEDDDPTLEMTSLGCSSDQGLGDTTSDIFNRQVSIDLQAGHTITCTFGNADNTGRIVIREFSSGVDGPIGFTSDLPGNATFSLDANGSLSVSDVPAGTYTVTEDADPALEMTSLGCSSDQGLGDTTSDIFNRQVSIDLQAGHTITCTFGNADNTGTIIIRQQTNPSNEGLFHFASEIPSHEFFDLRGGESEVMQRVPAGQYAVAQTNPAPYYSFSSLGCSSNEGIGDTTTDTAVRLVDIDLQAGHTITCTYVSNREPQQEIDVTGTLDFGDVPVNGGSATQTITIHNIGELPLSVVPPIEHEGDISEFDIVDNTTSEVAPGSSTTFDVTFDPSVEGPRVYVVLVISDDQDESILQLDFTGTGTVPHIRVEGTADFGSEDVNGGTATQTFTIHNDGGDTLDLGSLSMVSGDTGDFSVTAGPGSSAIGPGGSTTFDVTFDPTAVGGRTATLRIPSDDFAETPTDIVLTGFGATAQMLLNPSFEKGVDTDATHWTVRPGGAGRECGVPLLAHSGDCFMGFVDGAFHRKLYQVAFPPTSDPMMYRVTMWISGAGMERKRAFFGARVFYMDGTREDFGKVINQGSYVFAERAVTFTPGKPVRKIFVGVLDNGGPTGTYSIDDVALAIVGPAP